MGWAMNRSDPDPMSRGTPRSRRRVIGESPDHALPLISILTVVYNGAKTLETAIRSVIEQTYPNLEYIVIDGASTDSTVELIERYAHQIDYWVSEPDAGIYDAMNKALAAARGDWVLFVGADDELKPGLHAVANELDDPLAVYYGVVEIAGTGRISGGRFSRYRLMQENICHQAVFYPRSVYQSKPYDTHVGMLADHKYNIELWGAGVRFRYLNRVICRFNDKGLSSANGVSSEFGAVKLATIRSSFGPIFHGLKRARSLAVRYLKKRA
jgi:glycosyltransferase involved in cell wall biosynthesis